MTPAQLQRVEQDYSKIAGEPVTVDRICDTLYVYGSELATLRLFRKMPNKRQGYSENLQTFYFSLDLLHSAAHYSIADFKESNHGFS